MLKCMLQLQIFTIERQWTRDACIMQRPSGRLTNEGDQASFFRRASDDYLYNSDNLAIACASRLLVYVCGNDKDCMRIVDVKLII